MNTQKKISNKLSRLKKNSLRPNRHVIVVSDSGLIELPAEQVTPLSVGQKAAGLLTIPAHWTLPFFVVTDSALKQTPHGRFQHLLDQAAVRSGVTSGNVMVRSNGVEEGVSQRGALFSLECAWDDLEQTLLALRAKAVEVTTSPIHWIVQTRAIALIQGQMSNERRVRYDKRDWAIEIEAADRKSGDQISIAVRRWRDGYDVTDTPLLCDSALKTSLVLKRVAMWAVQDPRRFLFEWVWDGSFVHLVQMDVATTIGGENPKDLLPLDVPAIDVGPLQIFRIAGPEHNKRLRKLANASLYEELGYSMPLFYVLDQQDVIKEILDEGKVSPALLADLDVLTRRPLVLRTDGENIPPDKREMLPRTEELRSVDAATHWLLENFRPTILKLGLSNGSFALIGHHFIPSISSAWAGAEPGKRWVRIEALWGIPESLYWHSHDTFEVDTERANLNVSFSDSKFEYPIRHRERFKGTFIAPNADGAWIHHETKEPFDWSATINSDECLREIAHTTRRICERLQKPVEVMWFVDNHNGATHHRVLPWYHSIPDNTDVPVRAPRKKIKSSQERYIRNRQDWESLQAVTGSTRIERIIVEPRDPELIRNLAFAEELGTLAAQHGIVIVLAGGILSHAYHALRRAGASVECVDLFGATEDKAEYNKLVRDRVPAQIADRGEHFEIVRLQDEALVVALRRKLVEESLEALDASTGTDLIGELADVQEVVRAIIKAIQVSSQQLEEERLRKLKKRGGFEEGYMLLRTASPYSLGRSQSPDSMIVQSDNQPIRTIRNASEVPQKAVYKKPDHRNLADSTEELLVVETELNRLGTLVESINFEIPSNVDPQQYTSLIELSRIGGELRAAIRLRLRKRDREDDMQLNLNFDD